MLADLVKAGKLPALEARLPKKPMVMVGYEGVGKFGGTWRRAFQGVSDINGPTKVVDRAWAWFDKNLNLVPRVLDSWSVSADGKVWTIKLREGLKWSDGKADYTTDDIDFWYKNELQNKKLTPGTNTKWYDPDKTIVKFAAVDKYTATWTYTKPKPMFIYNMTRSGNGNVPGANAPDPVTPAHYLKQFHEDTTTDKAALEADVKKRGFADWQSYYSNFARSWTANPEKPSIGAWLSKNTHSDELFLMERNPYFWAVDTAGNQLPYIDKVTHRVYAAAAADVLTLRVTNGEIDMQYRLMTIANLPVYKAGEAKGDYKVVIGALASHICFNCNLTTKNKPLAEFFNQRDARIAMSLGIDRNNINQLVYNGLLTPRQYSPTKASPQYYEKLTNAYIKYDPDTANKMLDAAGYSKKDANGIRLYKDGSGPISFTIEGITSSGQDVDAANLVSKDLAKIGIKATYKFVERALYTTHYTANDIEAGWFGADRAVLPLVPEAIIFRGVQPDRPWCPAWGFWYLNPKDPNAVEPPKDHWIRNIWKIWDEEIAIEPDAAKQNAAFKKVLDIWATELPFVSLLGELPAVTIVKNGFKGYLPGMPNDDTTGDEHFPQSETYYWDDPSKHTA
jgi:peptide/nickel transport system substrate-binding protein